MLQKIKLIKDKLYKYETNVLFIFIIILVLVSFIQVMMRKFFNSGIPNSEKIITMMIFYITLIGASAAILKEKHISIEILTNFVSKRINIIFNLLSNIFALSISILLYFYSLKYLAGQKGNLEEFLFSITVIEMETFMLPCFLLFILGFLLNLTENIYSLLKRGDK